MAIANDLNIIKKLAVSESISFPFARFHTKMTLRSNAPAGAAALSSEEHR